jgi:hypothetical protein
MHSSGQEMVTNHKLNMPAELLVLFQSCRGGCGKKSKSHTLVERLGPKRFIAIIALAIPLNCFRFRAKVVACLPTSVSGTGCVPPFVTTHSCFNACRNSTLHSLSITLLCLIFMHQSAGLPQLGFGTISAVWKRTAAPSSCKGTHAAFSQQHDSPEHMYVQQRIHRAATTPRKGFTSAAVIRFLGLFSNMHNTRSLAGLDRRVHDCDVMRGYS